MKSHESNFESISKLPVGGGPEGLVPGPTEVLLLV